MRDTYYINNVDILISSIVRDDLGTVKVCTLSNSVLALHLLNKYVPHYADVVMSYIPRVKMNNMCVNMFIKCPSIFG